MGGKSKDTTSEVRQLVIFHNARGLSGDKVAKLLNLKRSTVYNIIRSFKEENRIDRKPRSGRPKRLSVQDKRYIIRKIERNPKVSAEHLSRDLSKRCAKPVTGQTVRNLLRETGYSSRTARNKPYISEVNRKKRLEFAEKYISEDETFWRTVIFSDESKFNLFGNDGKMKVWRKPNTSLEAKNINVTVKHGGGNVMVWGCFAASGVGSLEFIEGTMTAKDYIEVLKKNLRSSAEKLGLLNSYQFYQDNDPKHKALITREWMLYNCRKVLDTPPQSPDLNPIENLWHLLDKNICKNPVSNKYEMRERLLAEWNQLPADYLSTLVESMSRRLAAVIEARGGHTKY